MIREQATYFAAALSQSESTADAAVQAASAGSREPLILCLVLLILLLASLILLNFSALIWERRIYKATTDIRKLLSELPGKTERPSEDIRPGFSSEIQGSDGTDSEDSDGSGGSQEPTRSRSEGQNTGSSSLQASRDSGEIQGEKDSGKKIQKAEGSRSDAPDTLPEPTVHDPSPYVLTPAQPHRVDGLIVNSAVYYNLSERIFFDRSNSGREPFDLFSDDTVLPAQDCFQISSTAAYYQNQNFHRVFDFITTSGAPAALTGRIKLLKTERPATVAYEQNRIYLKQKGILIVEERQG